MRKKDKKRLLTLALGYLFVMSNSLTPVIYGAASGNYTETLPPLVASDVTMISRGSSWAITTLPPTNTFGDSLSRVVDTVYQSTQSIVFGGNTATAVSTITALPTLGFVGSTTFPAAWVATGRTIRFTTSGRYTTSTGTWTWDLLLGTTSVLTTGAVTTVGSETDKYFKATGLLTIAATGNAGSVNGTYDLMVTSGSIPSTVVSYSTMTGAAVTVDLTSQLTFRPRFTWGSPATGNSILFNNIIVEFLN